MDDYIWQKLRILKNGDELQAWCDVEVVEPYLHDVYVLIDQAFGDERDFQYTMYGIKYHLLFNVTQCYVLLLTM